MVYGKATIHPIRRRDVDGWICAGVCDPRMPPPRSIDQSHRLGDRHGENLLFEEGAGGILHVDFNCLFDKVWIERQLWASRG